MKIYEVYYKLFEDILRAELLDLGGIGNRYFPMWWAKLVWNIGSALD